MAQTVIEKQVNEITYVYTIHPNGRGTLASKTNHLTVKDDRAESRFIVPDTLFMHVFRGVIPPEEIPKESMGPIFSFWAMCDYTGKIQEVTFWLSGAQMPFSFEQFYQFEKRMKEYQFKVRGNPVKGKYADIFGVIYRRNL